MLARGTVIALAVGGALAALDAYLKCWGQPDPCPNATNIRRLLKAILAILAAAIATILAGAGTSAGLCAIPTIGVLISIFASTATTIAAYATLGGVEVMIGSAIYLLYLYQDCRNRQYTDGDESKPSDPSDPPPSAVVKPGDPSPKA